MLVKYDELLHDTLESVLNITLSLNTWDQTTLPVSMGGLGIRKATRLASMAYLSSVFGSADLQLNILFDRLHEFSALYDACFMDAVGTWRTLSGTSTPVG